MGWLTPGMTITGFGAALDSVAPAGGVLIADQIGSPLPSRGISPPVPIWRVAPTCSGDGAQAAQSRRATRPQLLLMGMDTSIA